MELKLNETQLKNLFNYLNKQPYEVSAPIIKFLYDAMNERVEKEIEEVKAETQEVKQEIKKVTRKLKTA